MTTRAKASGRGWAYTGATLGGLVSIAANVAHSFIPPTGAPAEWAPEPGAVVGAIVWPVFLFIAVEILARVPWPAGLAWQMLRWGGLLPVAAVAAFVSYRHLSGLLAHYGEEPVVYYLGPLAVDGLMIMAAGALIATGHHRLTATPTGTAAAATGGPATPTRTPPTPANIPSTPPAAPSPVTVPSPAEVAHRITRPRPALTPAASPAVSPGTRPTRTRPSKTAAAPAVRSAPSTTDIPVTASDAAAPLPPVAPPAQLARAAQVANDYRTQHGTPITAGQLAVRLQVSSDVATQLLAVLNLHPDNPTKPITTVNGTPAKATR